MVRKGCLRPVLGLWLSPGGAALSRSRSAPRAQSPRAPPGSRTSQQGHRAPSRALGGTSSRPHGTLGPQAAVWMSQGQISSCNLPHPTLALSASEGPPCKTGREPRAALWTLTLCSVALMLATERESTLRAGLPFTLLGAPLSNPRARSGA